MGAGRVRLARLVTRVAPALVAVAALSVAGNVVNPGVAHSDPDQVSVAQRKLAKIHAESSAIDSKYSDLQSKLDTANANLKRSDAALAAGTKKVASLRAGLGQIALVNFQTVGVGTTTQLVTSADDSSFLAKLAVVQNVTERSNGKLQELQASEADLAATRAQAKQTRDQIAALTSDQKALVKEYDAKEKAAQQLVSRLTAQEKARLARLERQQNRAQLAALERSQARTTGATSRSTARRAVTTASDDSSSSGSAGASSNASGRAAVAVSFALAQVGKPYVFGATGLGAYDCSGLMLRAWGAAGVSLPRTSQAQYGAGSHVSISSLQPGDLVFYYSGISHVGMYIGGGKIVHAANPRTGVQIASVSSMPIVGATHVG